MPGGHPLSLFARKGRIVYRESHLNSRLGYLYELVRLHAVGRAHRVAYVYLFKTGEADDIAGYRPFAGYAA